MDTARTGAVERIARVIAGWQLSANAEGKDPHAAAAVDAEWPRHRGDALAILRTLREPDAAMAAAGDAAVWSRMIAAAIGDHEGAASPEYVPPAPGTDPLHQGP